MESQKLKQFLFCPFFSILLFIVNNFIYSYALLNLNDTIENYLHIQ